MVPNNPHFSSRFMGREKALGLIPFGGCCSVVLQQQRARLENTRAKFRSPYLFSTSFFQMPFFFFFNLPASYFFFPPLGFAFFLWLWQENLSAVFQYTQAGLVLGRRVSLPICNHRFMAFTRGVNADQMENTPARALQLLALPHIRSQSLILIIRPKGNSVCSPNASQLSRWSGISFLRFPS